MRWIFLAHLAIWKIAQWLNYCGDYLLSCLRTIVRMLSNFPTFYANCKSKSRSSALVLARGALISASGSIEFDLLPLWAESSKKKSNWGRPSFDHVTPACLRSNENLKSETYFLNTPKHFNYLPTAIKHSSGSIAPAALPHEILPRPLANCGWANFLISANNEWA